MKKTVGVLSGLVVAVAAVSTAGAWYTGKQLPEVLKQAMLQANAQLQQSAGTGASVTLELASLESHLYSSTAHYRVKVKDMMVGDEPQSFELAFVDRIEHGPLPWSRLKALKLMPVMAASNYALEKDALTSEWFAISGGVPPVYGQNSLGYDGSTDGTLIIPPMEVTEAGSHITFSGLTIQASGTKDAEQIKFSGGSASLGLDLVDADSAPLKLEFKGINLLGDMSKTDFGFYVGTMNMGLDEVSATLGEQQKVLLMKHVEQNNAYRADGNKFSGTMVYKVGDINFDGKPVGAGEMTWSVKNIDIPATQALVTLYQGYLPELEQASAQGEGMPALPMSEAETAQMHANLQQVLAGKPQIALDNFSFKTANGESRFSLSVDLAKPASLQLPADELYRQMVAQVQSKVSLSKPMIGDLAVLQARLEGQSDAQVLAQQASQAGEMVGMMAQQSQMATVKGNDILASLHYADGMVEFNGHKMTVEQFASLIQANLGAMQPSEG
ncbi:YdgA family protein [Pseudomonas sp. BJa5]|uniref:YdgA family protein n=1 Tax=Pseudomonas sp. BJa5 TaxID=2936270 RepID=UPI0025598AF0|nr:YdgA family protein [Pseudomonas sp. BGr12]MDL2421294.1 YdgA family protein [Pseudomonas sp. BGr12]